YPGADGQALADQPFLRGEQSQCVRVAANGGELGEAADVGEGHRPGEDLRARDHWLPSGWRHRGRTVILPESVLAITTTSCPGGDSTRARLESVLARTSGRHRSGRVTVTDPDIVSTSTSPWPSASSVTEPLM